MMASHITMKNLLYQQPISGSSVDSVKMIRIILFSHDGILMNNGDGDDDDPDDQDTDKYHEYHDPDEYHDHNEYHDYFLSAFLIIIFNFCQVLLSTVAAFLIIVSSLLLWTKVIRDRID